MRFVHDAFHGSYTDRSMTRSLHELSLEQVISSRPHMAAHGNGVIIAAEGRGGGHMWWGRNIMRRAGLSKETMVQ